MLDTGVVAVVTSLVAAGISIPVGIWAGPIGKSLGLLDFPDTNGGRKRHDAATPLVGGSALALSAFAACGLSMWLLPTGPWIVQHLLWLGVGLAAMYLIGMADDRFELGPVLRLVLAIVSLLVVILFAPDFSLGFLRFSGQETLLSIAGFGNAFALLCLVGLLNAVNMADGKNGIILSLGLIWSAVLAARLPAPMLPVLAASATALAIMLYFNLRGRLFMGDGGSYALSTLFGLLAIYSYNADFATMRADDVAVMFAIPVFDTIRLMGTRILSGRSPFEGGRDHLHHYLHHRYNWPNGLIVYISLVAIPNFGAVAWPGTGLIWLAVSLVMYSVGLWVAHPQHLPRSPA